LAFRGDTNNITCSKILANGLITLYRVFVPSRLLQPSLMFVSKARSLPYSEVKGVSCITCKH
jgi:hypothetical protein